MATDDLAREVETHLAMLEDEYRRRGMSDEEARRAARLALGGVTQTIEGYREARSIAWLADARRDAKHALRLLQRNPIMALTIVLSLAIGIGANTAIFTVANALLFRHPGGIVEPDRLVDIGVGRGPDGINPGSYPLYLDLSRQTTTLDGVYARQLFPHPVSFRAGERSSESVFGHLVSSNYFTVLGVRAQAGRMFGALDEAALPDGSFAVISHALWTRRFQRDPAVVGQTVRVNDRPTTIVGVADQAFHGTGVTGADVWLPMTTLSPRSLGNRSGGTVLMGGRVKAGVSFAQAAADVDRIGADLAAAHPEQASGERLRALPASVVPGNGGTVAIFMTPLMGIVSVVLLVACANLSGILLARGAARRREIAVRLAMGASRARLVRQLLMETLLLFAIGGAAGIALALTATRLTIAALPSLPFPVALAMPLDVRVVAFTVTLSLIAAVASGLAPALRASRPDVVPALKDEAPGPFGRGGLRRAFVVAQVALSLLLVIVSGLFARALERAGASDPGFDPAGVELATIDLSQAGYTETTGPRIARDLVARVRSAPGVAAATLALVLPGGFETQERGVRVPGATPPDGASSFGSDWNAVEPGYFATLRIPLAAGREFTDADRAGAELVAVVGEGLARQFWPGRDPIGQYVTLLGRQASERPMRVVGVARDVHASSLVDGPSQSLVYAPFAQHYLPRFTIVARSTRGQRLGDEIRAAVAAVDPALPIAGTQTLDEALALGVVPQRLVASISGSLGFVGLLLAAIGIFGITSYAVVCRTREIGVRVALGAKPSDVVRMILGEGLSVTLAGSAIGLVLGVGANRVLVGLLFGAPAFDPLTFAGAAVIFIASGLVACYIPVRRASRIHAMEALRCE